MLFCDECCPGRLQQPAQRGGGPGAVCEPEGATQRRRALRARMLSKSADIVQQFGREVDSMATLFESEKVRADCLRACCHCMDLSQLQCIFWF